jgi:hypothetical protein
MLFILYTHVKPCFLGTQFCIIICSYNVSLTDCRFNTYSYSWMVFWSQVFCIFHLSKLFSFSFWDIQFCTYFFIFSLTNYRMIQKKPLYLPCTFLFLDSFLKSILYFVLLFSLSDTQFCIYFSYVHLLIIEVTILYNYIMIHKPVCLACTAWKYLLVHGIPLILATCIW